MTGHGSATVPSRSAQLGRGAVAGSKVWDRQYGFRLCIGPLSLAQYESFLPDGPALPAVRDWVRQFVGIALLWDLRLVLAAAEVPPARLLSRGHGSPRTRLGLTTWLGSGRDGAACRSAQVEQDRDDLVLDPETVLRAAPAARRPSPEAHHV